ncbi:hypothetical protein [Nonomuraea diastatica]|uniref:Uncharacterized protein n=1 Tax=Nonomuraea diastatica TaxID=1848329 RepID=A0A4R4X7W1_9ACTN|nr:hypothetical protein [Nonomuraea diastatica]TDD26389.1 hypothetical protein E1294_00025 [Nonomuraea diastatica]
MYKSGLILAGLVGGLLMSGGSALAATYDDRDHDREVKIVLICGDGSIGREVDNQQNAQGLLAGVGLDNVLNHVLSHEHRECNIG